MNENGGNFNECKKESNDRRCEVETHKVSLQNNYKRFTNRLLLTLNKDFSTE